MGDNGVASPPQKFKKHIQFWEDDRTGHQKEQGNKKRDLPHNIQRAFEFALVVGIGAGLTVIFGNFPISFAAPEAVAEDADIKGCHKYAQ